MRDIVTLQLGGCGYTLGSMFWEDLFYEHHISFDGEIDFAGGESNSNPEIFLYERSENKYSPRTILIDSDPSLLQKIRSNSILSLIPESCHVVGTQGNEFNYSKGLKNTELVEQSLEACRKSSEACDELQAFQIFHSIGGGTGSGALASIIDSLSESYQNSQIVTITNVPSQKISELPLETLNSCLAIYPLVEKTSISLVLDNEKYYNSLVSHSNFESFNDINDTIRKEVSDFTSLLRFPRENLSSYLKIGAAIVPYPRLHFLNQTSCYESSKVSPNEIIFKTLDFEKLNLFGDADYCRSMVAVGISRGTLSYVAMQKELNQWIGKSRSRFVDWLPNQMSYHHSDTANKNTECSFSCLKNSMDMWRVFTRLSEQFSVIFRKKIGLAGYLENGMDEMEFTEAESNLNDMCSEFIPWGCSCYCWEEDDDELENNENYEKYNSNYSFEQRFNSSESETE